MRSKTKEKCTVYEGTTPSLGSEARHLGDMNRAQKQARQKEVH